MNQSHDDDGNMTTGPLPSDPSILALFIYDGQNRLREVRNATTGVTLTQNHFDSFSRRIASTSNGVTTIYLYNVWNVVVEHTASGSSAVSATLSKINLWGRDFSNTMQGAGGVGGLLAVTTHEVQSTTHFYPLYDGNGNVAEYINQTASVAVKFDYDAFGNITNQITNNPITNNLNYRFSTKPQDPTTGLYYYGYRFYDPTNGRWINRDPIEEEGGVNLYGFVGNEVVNMFDVLGMADFTSLEPKPFDCRVVVFWGHSADTWEALAYFSKNGGKCTKATGLACNTFPNRYLRDDQYMDDFDFNSEGSRCGVGKTKPCTNPEKGNGGRNPKNVKDPEKRSAEGWATLVAEAWTAAVEQAEAQCSKCNCKTIKVKFICTSDVKTLGHPPEQFDQWKRTTKELQERYERIESLIPDFFDFQSKMKTKDGEEYNKFPQACGETIEINCSKSNGN